MFVYVLLYICLCVAFADFTWERVYIWEEFCLWESLVILNYPAVDSTLKSKYWLAPAVWHVPNNAVAVGAQGWLYPGCGSSVQFKMVSMRSEKPMALHPVSQKLSQILLKLINTSDLPRRKPFVMVALLTSLFARSFSFTPACPGGTSTGYFLSK